MEEENKLNYPHWDVEETHVNKVAEIRNIFRQVLDPEIGMDIIQLGLIRNVTITDNKAKIEMILTTPYCPYAPMLMESARKKAEAVIGLPTEIKYGREVWNQTMMEDNTSFDWGLF
jgi:metal-sulfur cluster biosynthetic enzyme